LKQFSILVSLLVGLVIPLAPLGAEDYLIKPGDSLAVTVLAEPDLTRHVVVGPQGSIVLPLVNEVKVAGLTTTQAAEQVTRQLKQFMKNPQVTVELLEPAKTQVSVSGEVQKPGVYLVTAGARVMDVIAAAGGYTPNADLSSIKISHAGSSGAAAVVDLSKFLLSGDTSVNAAVAAGDTIWIPTRTTAAMGMVMVLGAVRQSGEYAVTQGMTLREAVMLAGGPTEFADLSSVTLRRQGSSQTITIDYAKAAAGDPSANPELKPGDVIYVAAREQVGFYTIQGAVTSPGRYDLRGKTPITEAIAIAGGVRDRAKLNDVRILRASDGAARTIQANISDIMAGKAENLTIENGDSIFVPTGSSRTDYLRIASLLISLAWLIHQR